MPSRALLPSALALLWLTACAASFELVEPPTRDADLYPRGESNLGVSVAVDPIDDPRRVTRYFGRNLLDWGILPVQVIVSNHSGGRVAIRPADVLLLEGRTVLDPIPVQHVADRVKDAAGFVRDETAEQVDAFFSSVALDEAVLAPGRTQQGVIFFDTPAREPEEHSRFFRRISLFPRARLQMNLAVTALDQQGARIHFGPFTLSPR